MGDSRFIDDDQAHGLLDAALEAVSALDSFCKISDDDLLAVAQKLEMLSRRIYGVQVGLTSEINSRSLADARSCTSTGALLRELLNITISEANGRVQAAKALIPQRLATGALVPAILPVLAEAVTEGTVDSDHVRVILGFEKKLPGKLTAAEREWAEGFLVDEACTSNAGSLSAVADYLENALNPDGTLHDLDPYDRMELIIGRRNKSTGLTVIKGRLDDLGIEMLRKALDMFTKPRCESNSSPATSRVDSTEDSDDGAVTIKVPRPTATTPSAATPTATQSTEAEILSIKEGESDSSGNESNVGGALCTSDVNRVDGADDTVDANSVNNVANENGVESTDSAGDVSSADDADGLRDTRPAPTRMAHALTEALQVLLDTGGLPVQGGERPHISVVIDWDLAAASIGAARLPSGVYLTPEKTRQLLCDAQITPAILGSKSELLDLGRTRRTFSPAQRRALVLRDGGCAWPGCCRPPEWTDAHHIRWWKRDLGETSVTTGVLLCKKHHTETHKDQWKIVMNADGLPEFIPPKWIDADQAPRQNTLHHNTNRLRRGTMVQKP